MTPPTTPPPQPSPPPSDPMSLIAAGLTANSLPLVRQGLDLFAASRRGLTPANLDRVLALAVKRGKADIVRYLIDEVGGRVEGVRAEWVGRAVREEGEGNVEGMLEVLVGRGWDVNGGSEVNLDPRYPPYPIYHLCGSERLVHWCLDHGARVAYPAVEALTPLLDHVARFSSSTVAVFKLLLERGAQLGRRTLHMAACSAAKGDEKTEVLGRKMEVVRFLVEEMGCDVNGMDVPEGEKYGGHYGTPMNYVAHWGGGGKGGDETVVRYLLEKGANPEIKDCWDLGDAFMYAEKGNKEVLEVLNQWRQQNKK